MEVIYYLFPPFHSKILGILTRQYGGLQDLRTVFSYLHQQPFPDRGGKVRVYAGTRTLEVERPSDLRFLQIIRHNFRIVLIEKPLGLSLPESALR